MSFKQLFSSFVLAILLSRVISIPFGTSSEGNTTSVDVPLYYDPEGVYETYGEGIDHPSGLSQQWNVEEAAVSFVAHKLGIGSDEILYRTGYSSEVVDHAYLNQVSNGISFVNAVANLAMKDGKIVAFGSSFVKLNKIASSQPTVNEDTAITAAETVLGCTYNSHPTSLRYHANLDGSASLVYVIQVRNDNAGKYYQVHVDAHSGTVVSTVNFVSAATYTAVPITSNSVLDGPTVLVNPEDKTASPNGWHNDGSFTYKYTRGNNGLVYRVIAGRFTFQSSAETYAYQYDTRLGSNAGSNLAASTVNAWYLLGKVHDFTYLYGFTEEAYNFQQYNFNRRGRQNDPIEVYVDEPSQFNNAFFYTPPDGQPGTCKLHIFTHTQPNRPAAMDNPLVVHEYGHGLSNRLVGGGSAACLQSPESQALGEGWSDVLADWTQQQARSGTKDFIFASYAIPANVNRYGFRKFPYSTDLRLNPLVYSDTTRYSEVHDLGQIYANMLHNIYAQLVSVYGFAHDAMSNPSRQQGNAVFLHLFIDSLAITPCYPTFIKARNAFIQADYNRYGGIHVCLLWREFAKRGLGYNAQGYLDNYRDNFDVAPGC